MTKNNKVKKVPVIYKGKSLMPTTQGRAYHLVKIGKAIFVKDKHIGWYLKLKVRPSGTYVQKVALGIDTGTMFIGLSIVGKNISTNIEFEQTQRLNNRNYIKIIQIQDLEIEELEEEDYVQENLGSQIELDIK